jgi:hypothetical protein
VPVQHLCDHFLIVHHAAKNLPKMVSGQIPDIKKAGYQVHAYHKDTSTYSQFILFESILGLIACT